MNNTQVIRALAALAQESRLAVYRLLVRRGPEGYAAGEVAQRLGIPPPTLSFHLKALAHAGLVTVRREGRFAHYAADFSGMDEVVSYLTDHCCSLATACAPAACAPSRPARRGRSAPVGRTAATRRRAR
jgi:ArsR family transcriptional regulator